MRQLRIGPLFFQTELASYYLVPKTKEPAKLRVVVSMWALGHASNMHISLFKNVALLFDVLNFTLEQVGFADGSSQLFWKKSGHQVN